MRQGLFISFEGVEGAGKSTQAALAAEAAREKGFTVYSTREPGGTPLAERIRTLILDTPDDPPIARAELLLMLAARAQHVDTVIAPRLARGEVVICDRFYDSTIAYQCRARGLDIDFGRDAIDFAIGGVRPDITILLDLPVGDGLARQQSRNRMEREALEFHEIVREGFLEQQRREPDRITLVDASGPVEEVRKRVMSALQPVFPSHRLNGCICV